MTNATTINYADSAALVFVAANALLAVFCYLVVLCWARSGALCW